MKKFFAMALAALSLSVACTPEESLPAVSFVSALPVTSDGDATFSIAVSNYTGTEAVTIPFVIGGDAVEGEDYTISAKEFVVGGANPVTEVTVSTLKFDTGKKVTLSLNAPAGWTLGNYSMSEYELSKKLGWISFDTKKSGMSSSLTVKVGIYGEDGKSLTLENGGQIEVTVDTENSTAEENVHFKFAGEKVVTIEAGKSTGELVLEMIGEDAVADHDQIVLKLNEGTKYNIGTTSKMTVVILGSEWRRLDGEWKIAKMHTSAAWADQFWSTMLTGYEHIPSYDTNPDDDVDVDTNVNDKIVFDMEALTLTPSFESSFKNYFVGVSNISPAGEYGLMFNGNGCWKSDHPLWGGPLKTPAMLLDNTNRYFSATEQSEDKESIMGYALTTDTEDNDILYIYLIDCESKTFFPEFHDPKTLGFEILGATKPVLVDSGFPDVFMIASFKKVK